MATFDDMDKLEQVYQSLPESEKADIDDLVSQLIVGIKYTCKSKGMTKPVSFGRGQALELLAALGVSGLI